MSHGLVALFGLTLLPKRDSYLSKMTNKLSTLNLTSTHASSHVSYRAVKMVPFIYTNKTEEKDRNVNGCHADIASCRSDHNMPGDSESIRASRVSRGAWAHI